MNITLTVEELYAHNNKLKKWVYRRAVFTVEHLGKGAVIETDQSGKVTAKAPTDLAEAIEKWDERHPIPTLIPKV